MEKENILKKDELLDQLFEEMKIIQIKKFALTLCVEKNNNPSSYFNCKQKVIDSFQLGLEILNKSK